MIRIAKYTPEEIERIKQSSTVTDGFLFNKVILHFNDDGHSEKWVEASDKGCKNITVLELKGYIPKELYLVFELKSNGYKHNHFFCSDIQMNPTAVGSFIIVDTKYWNYTIGRKS